jgi:hypothetical protein
MCRAWDRPAGTTARRKIGPHKGRTDALFTHRPFRISLAAIRESAKLGGVQVLRDLAADG